MASPLQKSPRGLLESYDLKTLGEAPSLFGDTLAPVVETFPFYTQNLLFSGQTAAATVAAFNQTLVQVVAFPTLVRSLGFSFIEGAAAGTFMHWALGLRVGPTVVAYLGGGSFGAIAAGATRNGGITIPIPVVIPAGSAFVGHFTSDAAGADHTFRLNQLTTEVSAVGL